MKAQVINKGTALLTLVSLAVIIVTLGVFLDGNVIPNPSSSEHLLDTTVAHAAVSSSVNKSASSDQPSAVAQQLKRAIDAANESKSDETSALADKQVASKEKIAEINRLLEDKGVIKAMDSESKKSQQFNQKIEDLKTRLMKLQPSN